MVLVLEVRGVEVLVTGAGCLAGTGGATWHRRQHPLVNMYLCSSKHILYNSKKAMS